MRDAAWGLGQMRNDVLHPYRTEFWVMDSCDCLASEILRVADDILDRVDRRNRRVLVSEGAENFGAVALADPVLNDFVELVGVRDAAGVIGEPGFIDQVIPADDAHDAFSDRLRARRKREPSSISGPVRVSGSGEWCAVSGSPLHDAELVVNQCLGTEDPEQRLV